MILDYDSLHSTLPREKDKEKALILKSICETPDATRKKIIQALSIRPSTVSRDVAEMIEDGILIEDQNKANIGRGRPEFFLEINYNRFLSISFSIISMNLLAAVINLKGDVIEEVSIKLDLDIDSDKMLREINKVMSIFRRKVPVNSEILGFGFAVPGLIDKKGKVWRMVSRFPKMEKLDLTNIEGGEKRGIIIERNIDSLLKYCLLTKPESAKGTTLLIHWGYGIAVSCAMEGRILQSPNGLFGEIGHWDMNLGQSKASTLESMAALSSILHNNNWNESIDERAIVEIVSNGFFPSEKLREIKGMIQGVIKNLYLTFFPDTIFILSPFVSPETSEIMESELKESLPGFIEKCPSIQSLEYSENGEIIGIANSVLSKNLERYLTARW